MRSVTFKICFLVGITFALHVAQPLAAGSMELIQETDVAAEVAHGREISQRILRVADHLESEDPQTPFVPAPPNGHLIIVRHADRDPGELVLNARGAVRALALPSAIADIRLDVIAISDFQRNKDTAAPLAADRALAPMVLPVDAHLAKSLVQMADDNSVIWIGNVGNLAEIWDAFRLEGRPPIDYGQIAILTAMDGVWDVSWRQF